MHAIQTFLLGMTVFVSFAVSPATWASLGRPESSIDADQSNLNAHSHIRTSSAKYTTHELASQMNTVIEYADAAGMIFAVTWHGVVKPDLETLLGSYFKEYSDSDSQRPRMRTRHPVQIKTANVIVMKDGHMRDVRGRAYLPSKLPFGVNLWDLD